MSQELVLLSDIPLTPELMAHTARGVIPDGSGISAMPSGTIRKQPTSSAGPYRFLTPRTVRRIECRSPSKCRTTSTRCSSTRGPAIAPSLVTCPTRTQAMLRSLATAVRAAATARTWLTPPAVPSTAADAIVCTESTISSRGLTSST